MRPTRILTLAAAALLLAACQAGDATSPSVSAEDGVVRLNTADGHMGGSGGITGGGTTGTSSTSTDGGGSTESTTTSTDTTAINRGGHMFGSGG